MVMVRFPFSYVASWMLSIEDRSRVFMSVMSDGFMNAFCVGNSYCYLLYDFTFRVFCANLGLIQFYVQQQHLRCV